MHTIRNITPADYDPLIMLLNDWWGGRKMTDMLPRLFFNHFHNTSFIIEEEGIIKGFIIGFISPSDTSVGYVHFVGVNPEYRKRGTGLTLYQLFINKVKKIGVSEVECVTSPLNRTSVSFHKRIGFEIKEGDSKTEHGISFHSNYDGPGEDRVILRLKIKDNT